MRFRVGQLTEVSNCEYEIKIIHDNVDRATAKSILRNLFKTGSDVNENTGIRYIWYFVDCLDEDGCWYNVSDYWNYQELDAIEELYDAGKVSEEYMENYDVKYVVDPWSYFSTLQIA